MAKEIEFNKKLFSKEDISSYEKIIKEFKIKRPLGRVFEEVLKLSFLLSKKKEETALSVFELKKMMLEIESKGEKYSPFVKRFVLQNLPDFLSVRNLPSSERQQKILALMYDKSIKSNILLHIDFDEYRQTLSQGFSFVDKNFFMQLCAVTERLVSSDSKKTLIQSPDKRIQEIEEVTLQEVSPLVKQAVKQALFSFKRERIRLSKKSEGHLFENYALLKKMCHKYVFDINLKTKKYSGQKRKIKGENVRVKS